MVDVGNGQAIIVIPGIQGRWEWMRPAVDALARQWRVVTSSLPGEPGSASFPDDGGFDQLVRHIDELMDAARLSRAVICGVSFGGLVALRYAARRSTRVTALILVSTPGPRWTPDRQTAGYLRRPVLCSPLFLLRAPARFWPELRATFPELSPRMNFCRKMLSRLLMAPASPSRMSRRAGLACRERFDADCAGIVAPTLVVAGERELDRVIDVDGTMEYVSAIQGAQFQRIGNTGHLGTITDPEQFVAIVSAFLKDLCC